ncbi:MAG: hypothetical protein K8W52_01490 [Deltaproteobacteria bacterium]|nr:hypothetical protein [Deltaproteobacteria bacterium]
MRYQLRQRFWSLTARFAIANDRAEEVATVDSEPFSLGTRLSLKDARGVERAVINRRLLSWQPTYELFRDGALAAVVHKQFTLFRCAFTIDVPGPDDLVATGSMLDHEYVFTRGDRAVAHVTKAWPALADCYGVELLPDEDAILILASAIVIDMACHDGKR